VGGISGPSAYWEHTTPEGNLGEGQESKTLLPEMNCCPQPPFACYACYPQVYHLRFLNLESHKRPSCHPFHFIRRDEWPLRGCGAGSGIAFVLHRIAAGLTASISTRGERSLDRIYYEAVCACFGGGLHVPVWYLGTKEHGTTDMVEIGDSAEARGATFCTPGAAMVKPLDVATSSPGNESAVFNLEGQMKPYFPGSTSLFVCLLPTFCFPPASHSAPSDFHATR